MSPLNEGSPANVALRAEVHGLAEAVGELSRVFKRRIKLMWIALGVVTSLVAISVITLFALTSYYHHQENQLVNRFETFVNRAAGTCETRNAQAQATNNLITGILSLQSQSLHHLHRHLSKREQAQVAEYTKLLTDYNKVEGKPVVCQDLNSLK